MPELPEVETIVSDLRSVLIGLIFVDIESKHNNTITKSLDKTSLIAGKKVISVERRGKFINIFFENDFVMTIHLRMSGRILFRALEDEALFYAGIRPSTNIENIDEDSLKLLFESILKALKQGIRNRGTSISDFRDAYGSTGRNQEKLYVYGRAGQECLKCSNLLIRIKVAGRGTVYCEQCQQ